MRRAHGGGFIFNKKGEFLGICLGRDYCAEHEIGIPELRSMFGVKSELLGIEGYSATRYIEHKINFHIETGAKEPWAFLIANDRYEESDNTEKEIRRRIDFYKGGELYLYEPNTVVTAWDAASFGIHVRGEENIAYLAELHEEMKKCNITFSSPRRIGLDFRVFSGLCVVIRDRIDEECVDEIRKQDEDNRALNAAAEATGIREYLRHHKKRFIALKPAWNHDPKTRHPSAYNVIFWLNPWEQDKDNFGWFTVEDLMDWAAGKGIIPKQPVNV